MQSHRVQVIRKLLLDVLQLIVRWIFFYFEFKPWHFDCRHEFFCEICERIIFFLDFHPLLYSVLQESLPSLTKNAFNLWFVHWSLFGFFFCCCFFFRNFHFKFLDFTHLDVQLLSCFLLLPFQRLFESFIFCLKLKFLSHVFMFLKFFLFAGTCFHNCHSLTLSAPKLSVLVEVSWTCACSWSMYIVDLFHSHRHWQEFIWTFQVIRNLFLFWI